MGKTMQGLRDFAKRVSGDTEIVVKADGKWFEVDRFKLVHEPEGNTLEVHLGAQVGYE